MSADLRASTVLFDFSEKNLAALVASCAGDPLLRIVEENVPSSATILEAGAGSGRWVKTLTDRGYHVTGVELNPTDVERFRKVWPEIPFDHGDVETLPYADASFDALLSLGVIEHLFHGPDNAMKEMRRVLKPNGMLVLTVPHNNCSFLLERLKDAVLHRLNASKGLRRRLGKAALSYDDHAVRQRLASVDRHRWQGLPVKYRFSPADGRDFYEYRFTCAQIRRLVERFGFSVEAVRILYSEERLYQIFGRALGDYDGCSPPRMNSLGRLMVKLLPTRWIGHMALVIARAR